MRPDRPAAFGAAPPPQPAEPSAGAQLFPVLISPSVLRAFALSSNSRPVMCSGDLFIPTVRKLSKVTIMSRPRLAGTQREDRKSSPRRKTSSTRGPAGQEGPAGGEPRLQAPPPFPRPGPAPARRHVVPSALGGSDRSPSRAAPSPSRPASGVPDPLASLGVPGRARPRLPGVLGVAARNFLHSYDEPGAVVNRFPPVVGSE